MRFDRHSSTGAGIPTSSMADIAFLLIIFFMVTSVFSATKGLELSLPGDDKVPPDPEPDSAVFIHVQKDRVLVDCREMSLEQILSYLEPKLVRNPGKAVILYTAPSAEYEKMVAVYDVLAGTRREGSSRPFVVRNISIPTKSEIEEYVAVFGANPLETHCE